MSVVQQLVVRSVPVSGLVTPEPMSLPSLMQHVQVLEECGWIHTTKVGRVRMCHLNPQALAVTALWLQQQRLLWDSRLRQLDQHLLTMKVKEVP